MTLFSGEPLPDPADWCTVRILHRRWMCGLWLVYVADGETGLFGFARLGFARTYSTALALAMRWLLVIAHRRHRRESAAGSA